jgi:hypothetical protein
VLAQTGNISIKSPSLAVALGFKRARGIFGFKEIDVPVDLARVEVGAALITIESELAATEHVHTSGLTRPVEVDDITGANLLKRKTRRRMRKFEVSF